MKQSLLALEVERKQLLERLHQSRDRYRQQVRAVEVEKEVAQLKLSARRSLAEARGESLVQSVASAWTGFVPRSLVFGLLKKHPYYVPAAAVVGIAVFVVGRRKGYFRAASSSVAAPVARGVLSRLGRLASITTTATHLYSWLRRK
jgi:hypothetical protein